MRLTIKYLVVFKYLVVLLLALITFQGCSEPKPKPKVIDNSCYFTEISLAAFQKNGHHDFEASRIYLTGRNSSGDVWQGPLKIINDMGEEVVINLSLIRSLHIDKKNKILAIQTFSGSEGYVHFVYLNSGKQFDSPLVFSSSQIEFKGNRLIIMPACYSSDLSSSKEKICYSALIYRLSTDKKLEIKEQESLDLTMKKIGYSFLGKRKFAK